MKLRPYQTKDVDLLSEQKSVAIFSEMRTGKTPVALNIFRKWGLTKLLIICPAILQNHWKEAVKQWLGQSSITLNSLKREGRQKIYRCFRKNGNLIVIVSKDTFRVDGEYFKQTRKPAKLAVIIDEAHFLGNFESQQSQSIYNLNDAEYKMVLTGTPMVNHPIDIFGILKFLKPELFSDYEEFCENYFHMTNYWREYIRRDGKRIGYGIEKPLGFKNKRKKEELYTILDQFSVNHRQEEVMPWLAGQVKKETIELELTPLQSELYQKWEGEWKFANPLELLTRLKTLIMHPPSLIKESEISEEEEILLLMTGKSLLPSYSLTDEEKEELSEELGSKMKFLVDYCQKDDNSSILIFSTRSGTFLTPLYQLLTKTLKQEIGLIIGSTPLKTREKLVNSFQSKLIRVLLINIKSGGVGLNLSRADKVIFVDRSWSPADNEQAEDRILPVNEEDARPKTIIDLIVKKTIDEMIIKLLKKKMNITKLIKDKPEEFFVSNSPKKKKKSTEDVKINKLGVNKDMPGYLSHPWIWAIDPQTSEVNVEDYNNLSRGGKWLIFVENERAKEDWIKIHKATKSGKLGGQAKMSIEFNNHSSFKSNQRQVICIYNKNYRDKAEVLRIRKKLNELGFTEPLCYKTDESTFQAKYGHASHYLCRI